MGFLRHLATKSAILIIFMIDLAIFIGIFFTKDNTVTLSVMLAVSAVTILIFGGILVYVKKNIGTTKYSDMYKTLKKFLTTNPDKGIHLFDRDGPLHEIHPEEMVPSDLIPLSGSQMRNLADK
jgi:hypothetical protein